MQRDAANALPGTLQAEARRMLHVTIKRVTEDIAVFKYNTAIAALMDYLNFLSARKDVTSNELQTMLVLAAPFAPYVTEELWEHLGNMHSVHQAPWPTYELEALLSDTIMLLVQGDGR